MPNWKSYESSVRLLSAIVAAHPTLKLNYDEVGKFYGGKTTYKAVWGRMAQINKHAKLLTAAVESGQDPIGVELIDGPQSGKPKAQDIAARFGGDCTKSAVENRFRRVKTDAKLINTALAKGIDPITLNIGDTAGEVAAGGNTGEPRRDIARCYGSEATKGAIAKVCNRNIKPNVKDIMASLEAGGDPKDVALRGLDKSGNEIARHFGSDTSSGGIQKHIYRHITPGVTLLRDRVKAGGDPKDLNIGGDAKDKKGNELAACFGSDATAGGIKFQVQTTVKGNVKLIKEARAAGKDCKGLGIGESGKPKSVKEIARIFGSDCTPNGLRFQFTDRFRPLAKRQLDMLAAGQDPKDVGLDAGKTTKRGNDMSKYFGSDSTKGGIEFQFRTIKADAKRQRECYHAGRDPQILHIGGGKEIARHLNDGTTASALDHRFRPIKKDATAMRTAIANQYGDGVSGKAVSTYFERARKDPNWNLSNTAAENGGTPVKAARTPKGSAKKKAVKNEDNDSDDGSDMNTPSKKSKVLNKVKNGRVSKPNARAKAAATYIEPDEGDDIVKSEEGSFARQVAAHDNENNTFGGEFYPTGELFDNDTGTQSGYLPEDQYEG